ncbi:MAG: FAD-binding oxidoreductase, partial [Actinobacteria bacterium]|nr:FAD-binding oxidoreductase [Actinomycetota bacterium]
AAKRYPALSRAFSKGGWAGIYDVTPDWHPILDQLEVQGFYCAVGFSGHGFQHAPVVGKLLAELILDGRAATVDVSSLGYERFARGELAREGHVV